MRLIATEEAARSPLLAADEPAPVEVVNPEGRGAALLTCDHASNRLPRRLGTLGLGREELASHIAWDPGAAWVARHLSRLLDAPLLLSGYSRLAIDCNRPPESDDSIARTSAGIAVPGNQDLTPAEAQSRVDSLFWPYQHAVGALLEQRARRGRLRALLAIHSFTPDFPGQARPWFVCISYNRDRRLAAGLLRALAADPGLVVGDNQPYAVEDAGDYTIPVHGEGRGLPHALIEIRQDLLTDEPEARVWAERIAAAAIAAMPDLDPLSGPGGEQQAGEKRP
jgi:predicted N-formylglutamate amidohydrolase